MMPSPDLHPTPVTQSLPQGALATERVAILDCGAQYTKVIDRRVRELKVYSDIVSIDTPLDVLKTYQAIIISGGPESVFEAGSPQVDPQLFELGLPVLGICYGMQLMAHTLGGQVEPGTTKEYGETEITVSPDSPIFTGLEPKQWVLMSHGDHVTRCPDGFDALGHSGPIMAAMGHKAKRFYGLQFHPEVELSVHGVTMIDNFLKHVCQFEGAFPLESRLDSLIQQLQLQIGDRPVVSLVSGGVDSAVTTALLLKAVGPEQVYAIHMDTGFMRHNESDSVCEALEQSGLKHLQRLNVAEDFLNGTAEINPGQVIGPLKQLTDPEQKRRIIGDIFFKLTQDAITALKLDMNQTFIAQGTLRPDLIESGNLDISDKAHKIKTHHNDVPIIQAQRDKGLIVEPNRDFHKDEVRQLGRLLGLPESIVNRQPFPGPGLAIRVLCTDKPYHTDNQAQVNTQLGQIAAPYGLVGRVAPIRSVGVQGDFRTYRHLAVLAGLAPQDEAQLKQLVTTIPNQLPDINRVALILNPETVLPESIETIHPTTLSHESLDLLRLVDHQVQLAFAELLGKNRISQLLTVLLPFDPTQSTSQYSVAVRSVVTSDFMTARAARPGSEVPWSLLTTLDKQIRASFPIASVMLDLTGKPPATIEWE